ncbi:M15 family metallopeptidase [Leucobacter sp. M11]|uniref:M15 family metallopeptidase n=1 Tax=Leucobacter sp. M11 TaxID=2993565 RepID=UPI002D7F13BC|nr:M15 family metallopeptidase [Leucobacter sp. M11]MEB4615092.1 M15 family metallopeptidase [Leucobacter sp. M11]
MPDTTEPTPEPPASSPAEADGFDRARLSLDDPDSIWVISNKLRPLNPIDYTPGDLRMPNDVPNNNGQPLREAAATATEQLAAAAAAEGLQVRVLSAFRDYAYQVSLYDGYIARDGQAAADTYSARPGHSEHQTGLVVDFDDGGGCALQECFESTPAGAWLAEHGHEYGFVLRYPREKEHVTGFMYEPWHFRYVGVELATQLRESGIATLEEFFGLPDAGDYAPAGSPAGE